MMFFEMLGIAKEETKEEFTKCFPGSDRKDPGNLKTYVCSRLKMAKKVMLREKEGPAVPSRLNEEEEFFDEQTERVRRKYHPRCWRCLRKCRFCLLRRKKPAILPFRAEFMLPLFDVIETFTEKMDYEESSDEDGLPNGLEEVDDDESKKLMEKLFFSENEMSDEEEEVTASDGNTDIESNISDDD